MNDAKHSSVVNRIIWYVIIIAVSVWFITGLIPVVLAPARPSARAIACRSNLLQIGKAIEMYTEVPGNDGPPPSLDLLMPKYLNDVRCFRCPLNKSGTQDYEIVAHARITKEHEPKLVLCFDRVVHKDFNTRNVLFSDLSVEAINEDDFQKLLSNQRSAPVSK